ncbi:MAG: PEGA domain-containing protein [Gammaproteobacteria bacterium]|nr:PEGA domain-containing protein [Gammaproteobacteria bacterium]
MAEENNNSHFPSPDNENVGINDPITPIEFTPVDGSAKKLSFSFSPIKIILSLVLVLFAGAAWFVLSARSVYLDVTPGTSLVNVNHPLAIKIGPRYLVLEGALPITVAAQGYYDLESSLTVTTEQSQTFVIDMLPLPGFLTISSENVTGATVTIDGELVGLTPLTDFKIDAGEHELAITLERYEPFQTTIDIEGRQTSQRLDVKLLPAWAQVSFSTSPAGAMVTVNGVNQGATPLIAEILEGEHEILVKLAAHKAWTEYISVTARQDMTIPPIALEQADGLVLLQSSPTNANVTVDGVFQGQTPLEITVPPGVSHVLSFFLNGYEETRRSITTRPEEEASLNVDLSPILSLVEISVFPEDAQLFLNGESQGNANQTIELLAASQMLEIRREGYVTFETEFVSRPGLAQKLEVTLKTLEQQRIDSIKPFITNASGQSMKLVYPDGFQMGASRREPGRQANEILRNVSLTRPYYLSLMEVNNAQFAMFDSEHSSGVVEGRTLSNNNQPVVQLTWDNAALFCNWLSEQENLPPFYTVENDMVTGFNPDSTGYRMPTESEWAWAARVEGDPTSLLKFPWGPELPPPANQGNYADISAGVFLGRIIANYNDGYLGSAPIGSFPPNGNGFFDMGGNVAEWVHDYYGSSGQIGSAVEIDPMGPTEGTYHVIRGSGWGHGTVTELRLSFRDYNNEPRDDVGFRVARYLE